MKRTKEWWHRLTKDERRRLFELEHPYGSQYGVGGYLPDDCSECGRCGNPMLGCGLCRTCLTELDRLITKASISFVQ